MSNVRWPAGSYSVRSYSPQPVVQPVRMGAASEAREVCYNLTTLNRLETHEC